MYNLFDETSSFFFSISYLFYYRVFIAAIQLVTASADVCVIDCGQRTFAENILSDKVLLDPRSSLRGR